MEGIVLLYQRCLSKINLGTIIPMKLLSTTLGGCTLENNSCFAPRHLHLDYLNGYRTWIY